MSRILTSLAEAIAVLSIISIVFRMVRSFLDIAHAHTDVNQVAEHVDLSLTNYKVCTNPNDLMRLWCSLTALRLFLVILRCLFSPSERTPSILAHL